MKAYFLDTGKALSAQDLKDEGVPYWQAPANQSERDAFLQAVSQEYGYVARDEISLSHETPDLPNLEKKFWAEHRHDDDEVRCVKRGSAIFDVRSRDDRWMRIEVQQDDLIIVPANRYHRFKLDDGASIVCERLYQTDVGWVAHYREMR